VLAKTHAIVFNTGLYHNTLEKWEEVPISQANYDNFCKHMIQAQTRLQNKKTSKQHGYGMAAEQIQELTENFCNIVTSEQQDKDNDCTAINLMRQEMVAMRLLIEQFQNKALPPPRNC
jgi:phosphomannomutase